MKEENKIKECSESDRKARVAKVTKILETVKYPTESDRLAAVLSFSRSKLSESEIESLAVTMRPDYNKVSNRWTGTGSGVF